MLFVEISRWPKADYGSLSCQYEHTIVITKGKPVIITAA